MSPELGKLLSELWYEHTKLDSDAMPTEIALKFNRLGFRICIDWLHEGDRHRVESRSILLRNDTLSEWADLTHLIRDCAREVEIKRAVLRS